MTAVKQETHQLVQAMLNGSINYFEGAERLIKLRDALGIYANDPDFLIFAAVLNEVSYLRKADGNFDWEKLKAPELQEQLSESLVWAKDISLHHLTAIEQRYAHIGHSG